MSSQVGHPSPGFVLWFGTVRPAGRPGGTASAAPPRPDPGMTCAVPAVELTSSISRAMHF